jgi:hypothetical protein
MAYHLAQMSLSPAVQELVDKWLKWDKNPQNVKEIQDLVAAKNETELKNRLATRIAFGTAGLYPIFTLIIMYGVIDLY